MIAALLQRLDRLPRGGLWAFAFVMLGAPFVPEPHLMEKARMLLAGTLTRPLDAFDVLWHLAPALLAALQAWRRERAGVQNGGGDSNCIGTRRVG